MDYNEFKAAVTEEISNRLQATDIIVESTSVQKNNIELDGLSFRRGGCSAAAVLYLNSMYEELDGDVTGAVQQIMDTLELNMPEDMFSIKSLNDIVYDWNKVKNLIIMKIVNVAGNAEFLKDKPHTTEAGLAAVYAIDVSNIMMDPRGLSTVTITDKHLDVLGVDLSQLHEAAVRNMESQADLQSMATILAGMMGVEADDVPDVPGMNVLTNTSRVNGAAMLFVPSAMDMVHERVGEDIVILPSSIHEVIILNRAGIFCDIKDMVAMVREINATQVSPEERLADDVFTYDFDSHTLERVNVTAEPECEMAI